MFNIKQTITHLQQCNQKAYYLAFLRVALCLWFLKELLFRWPLFEILYSKHSFFKIPPSLAFRFLHLNPAWYREHYLLVVYTCVILLVLNIFGIGRNVISFSLFIALTLLYSLNNKFANSGDEMSMLLAFYLSFANTFSHFTLFRRQAYSPSKEKLYNLVSNLAAYSILFNLCIVYFMAGLYKLQDPYWQKGTAVHYFLNDDRYSILAADKHVAAPAVLIYIINYGTILFELSFPFLVLFRRTRKAVLLLGLTMHFCIYLFLMIYGMSVIFIIQYGIFFSNQEIKSAAEKIKSILKLGKKPLAISQ